MANERVTMLSRIKTCFTLILLNLIIVSTFLFPTNIARSDQLSLKYNKSAVTAIDLELSNNKIDERDRAVLKGLRWCVIFCDRDENFNFTFANYVTMLDELTLHHPKSGLENIVHNIILKDFERARSRLHDLFPATANGYENFITILPIAYHHQVPISPLKEFADRHFAKVNLPDRLFEFRKAVKEHNYDRLTDLVVDAAFKNMAYRWKADRDFRLPADNYNIIMEECAKIPFLSKYDQDTYHDQNYYATHVLLALNHYGQEPLKPSPTSDAVFFYLVNEYKTVRYRVDDLDLLCEYLYCFRQFAPKGVTFINEGEQYILSLQNPDGSWGTEEDFEGDPYDQLHPTWTAITLLVQID